VHCPEVHESHECYQLTNKICKLKPYSQCTNHLQLSSFSLCLQRRFYTANAMRELTDYVSYCINDQSFIHMENRKNHLRFG
jgi:hypothetical protein